MRLWTIQPETLYEKLQSEKIFHCVPEHSELITEFGFGPAYDWMAEQMCERIGPPPRGVQYPIWAWHTIEWKHAKPDLRRSEFRGYKTPQVCLDIEVPDKEVLLSNEDMWHMVLNDGYYGDACSDEDYEAEEKWLDSLTTQEQIAVKRQSWKKIFDVFPARESEWDCHGKYIQATFWSLRLDQVKGVRHFAVKPAQNRATSFNIQTQSLTKSQKPKESDEIRRAAK